MTYLILSILCSVLLLSNFRVYPKYNVNTLHAIVFNYIVCFITAYVLMPADVSFTLDFSQNYTYYWLALGFGYIITFVMSSLSTQKVGMAITSIANNISLVIPVLCSIFIFESTGKTFDVYNYAGIILAIIAVLLATVKNTDAESGSKANILEKSILIISVFLLYGFNNAALNYLNLNTIKDPKLTIPITMIMILGAAISGLILLVYRIIVHKDKIALPSIIGSVTLGIPNFLSFYFIILAFGQFGNNGAFVFPIYNIGVILISSALAYLVFKEKLSKINISGLVLAIIAIGLISYQEIQAIF